MWILKRVLIMMKMIVYVDVHNINDEMYFKIIIYEFFFFNYFLIKIVFM